MEDAPEGADGVNAEDIGPLDLMAGVAGEAAPLPARKRKPALQGCIWSANAPTRQRICHKHTEANEGRES